MHLIYQEKKYLKFKIYLRQIVKETYLRLYILLLNAFMWNLKVCKKKKQNARYNIWAKQIQI